VGEDTEKRLGGHAKEVLLFQAQLTVDLHGCIFARIVDTCGVDEKRLTVFSNVHECITTSKNKPSITHLKTTEEKSRPKEAEDTSGRPG
jgi:hypothetical protein